MSLATLPDELLLEIFSYCTSDCRTTFCVSEHLENESSERIDRGLLFDLRRVCRNIERLVTPIAFKTLRLVQNLEHTQTLVNKIIASTPDPVIEYLTHLAISPEGMIPKKFYKMTRPRISPSDPMIGDNDEDPYLQGSEATHRWSKLLFAELIKLWIRLPRKLKEITIRDFTSNDRLIQDMEFLDRPFFHALSASLGHFEPAFADIKLSIYTERLEAIQALGDDLVKVTPLAETLLTEAYNPRAIRLTKTPKFMTTVKEFHVFSQNKGYEDWDNLRQIFRGFLWYPDTLQHLSVRSIRLSKKAWEGLKLNSAENLRTLVLEGIHLYDQSIMLLVRQLTQLISLKLFGCDIGDDDRYRVNFLNMDRDDQISKLRWSHIFDALTSLEKLVDLRLANLGYQSIRKAYKVLPTTIFWLFSDAHEDFEAFEKLRVGLVARRNLYRLPDRPWLSNLSVDGRWSQGGVPQEVFRGLTAIEIATTPRYKDLVQVREYGDNSEEEYGSEESYDDDEEEEEEEEEATDGEEGRRDAVGSDGSDTN